MLIRQRLRHSELPFDPSPLPQETVRSKRKDTLDSAYLRFDRVSKRVGNRHLSLP